jgi:hypothetical protein
LVAFVHPPLCWHGRLCAIDKRDAKHWSEFRHGVTACRYGTYCSDFLSPLHLQLFSHPFNKPCKANPYCSIMQRRDAAAAKHQEREAHVCPNGTDCTLLSDASHLRQFIHVLRPVCPSLTRSGRDRRLKNAPRGHRSNGSGRDRELECNDINEEHAALFHHPGSPALRQRCRDGMFCPIQFSAVHLRSFFHPSFRTQNCLDAQQNVKLAIDFRANQLRLQRQIKAHFKVNELKPIIHRSVLEFVQRLRPVHKCKLDIFKSILVQGVLLSASYMEELGDPKRAAEHTFLHTEIQNALRSYSARVKELCRVWINGIVATEYAALAD